MASITGNPNGVLHRTNSAKKIGEMGAESEGPIDAEFGETLPTIAGDRKGDQIEGKEGRKAKLGAVCFLGIFCSYFIYALLQEKITKRKFGDEHFYFFMVLVGLQCVINAAFAKILCLWSGKEVSLKPYRLFSVLSFTYVGAMVSSNSALAYITYPTQVLGKSAKPIPVLLFGVVLGRKAYPIVKYLIVLLIVVGVALFLYKDGGSGHHSNENGDQWRLFHFMGLGEILVIVSLTFDGITGVIQERLRSNFDVHALYMMYAVNVYSAVYLAVCVVLTGEGVEAMGFIQRHPTVILNILVFGAASAIGQYFIFTTITNFGPLTCSIFTTTRKFFTILASVIIFGNALVSRQWAGVLLVFLGLGLDIFFGRGKAQSKNGPGSATAKSKNGPGSGIAKSPSLGTATNSA